MVQIDFVQRKLGVREDDFGFETSTQTYINVNKLIVSRNRTHGMPESQV